MSRFIVLLGLLVAVVAVYGGDEEHNCGANETWNLCGHLCEPTCNNPNPNARWCPHIVCNNYTTAACRCNDGYLNNTAVGSCVLPADCPE